jgi:putative hemolysin
MTPRPDIEWLDLSESLEECRKKIVTGTHSRLPVGEERLKNFLGVVYAKDLLKDQLEGKAFDIDPI